MRTPAEQMPQPAPTGQSSRFTFHARPDHLIITPLKAAMRALTPHPFSHPDTLSAIRADLLLAWLWPMRDYFERRGLPLPSPGSREPLDCDKLAALFIEPTPDMPADCLEALYLFRQMGNPAGMDAILEAAQTRRLDLDLGNEPTPLDVVVRAWALDRILVEDLHNRLELSRPRAFGYFSATQHPAPPFAPPSLDRLALLEQRLNAFYEAWKRGKGARVFAYHQPPEWCFLVRHGAPCRREGAMRDDLPTTLFYRPQRHDILIYDPSRGEIRVNCCAVSERKVLLRLFGNCLFGRSDFFDATAKYTLAPLLRNGRACLACEDVPGIEFLSLKEVEFHYRDEPPHRDTLRADDIFALVEAARLRWPAGPDEITRATFEVKFSRVKRPRRFTIIPCNKVLYGRDSDGPLLDQLLQARGFILRQPDDISDAEALSA
jgi:hypothetical protein